MTQILPECLQLSLGALEGAAKEKAARTLADLVEKKRVESRGGVLVQGLLRIAPFQPAGGLGRVTGSATLNTGA